MAESPRIEELKRRVQVDPASIAFAALAEEYRRAARFEEAITTCQAGLQRHPAYLSARVTLGRALLELRRFDEARQELEHVLRAAPENLAAIRGLAEIHHRRGELPEALEQYRSALSVAKHDAELEGTVDQITKQVSRPEDPAAAAPSVAIPVDRTTEQRSEPVVERQPETLPRPHLELVMRQPVRSSGPEPEPEPEPEPRLEAEAEQTSFVLPESLAEPEQPTPGDAQHEDYDSPPEAAFVAAPIAYEPETELSQPVVQLAPEPAPASDPTVVALEGFLEAILREKAHLASRAAARR